MYDMALTLQCPSCGGVFLTLQQGGGSMEICPHCAVSSPREAFPISQGSSPGRGRTSLPSRRGIDKEALEPAAQPSDAAAAAQATIPADLSPAFAWSPLAAPVSQPRTAPALSVPPPVQYQAPSSWTPEGIPPFPLTGDSLPIPPAEALSESEASPETFHPENIASPPSTPDPPRDSVVSTYPWQKTAVAAPAPHSHSPPLEPVAAPGGHSAPPSTWGPATPAFTPAPASAPFTQTISPPPGAASPFSWTPSAISPPLPTATAPSAPPLTPYSSNGHPPAWLPPQAPDHVEPQSLPGHRQFSPVFSSVAEPPRLDPTLSPFLAASSAPSAAPLGPETHASPAPFGLTPHPWPPASHISAANPVTETSAPPQPVWPGLGIDGAESRDVPFSAIFRGQGQPNPFGPSASSVPVHSFSAGEKSHPHAPSHGFQEAAPPRRPAVLALALILIIGAIGWCLWKYQPELFRGRSQDSPGEPATIRSTVDPATTVPAALHPSSSAPKEETRHAQLVLTPPSIPEDMVPMPDGSEVLLASAAANLVKTLDSAVSLDQRMNCIADPARHRKEVDVFFKSIGGELKPVLLEPRPSFVTWVPGGETVKLFRLVTARCEKGAMVRLWRSPGEPDRLDWPLFLQSHEGLFDKFVSSSQSETQEKADWFSLLFKRRHDFELTAAARETYLCLEAQGSLAEGGTTILYVHKDLPAGRLLESATDWGRIYMTDLLVSKANVDGKKLNVVLDCSGTETRRK